MKDLEIKQKNVCFKKIWTNYSTVSLLWFVQIFLKQTLSDKNPKTKLPLYVMSQAKVTKGKQLSNFIQID